MNSETVAGTTAVIGTTTALFTAFMPGLTDVLQDSMTHSMTNEVRYAQVIASLTAVGIGGTVSYVTKSHVPLLISILGAVLLSTVYEMTLRKEA